MASTEPVGGNAQKSADQNTGVSSENVKLASEKAKKPEDTSNEVPNKQNQEANRSFRYPLDMKDTFPAKVKFQVIKVDGVDIYEKASQVLGNLGEGFVQGLQTVGTGIQTVGNAIIGLPQEEKRKNESVAESNVTAAESAETKKSSSSITEGTETFENKEEGTPYGDITLPLMQPLRYSDVADYNSNVSLGIIGGATESALKGGSPFDGLTEADGRLKGAAAGVAAQAIVQQGALISGLAGASVAKRLPILNKMKDAPLFTGLATAVALGNPFEKASQGVAAATRVTGNPNLRTLFKGVQMRPFTFDFKMVAYSPEEAREIKNIVKMFRTELYPESIDFNNIPVAYKFPNMFEISVTNKRGEHPGFKFQRCYLQNVETTFNEQAQGMFNDGQFVEVAISLKFIEIVTLTRQKVRDEDL